MSIISILLLGFIGLQTLGLLFGKLSMNLLISLSFLAILGYFFKKDNLLSIKLILTTTLSILLITIPAAVSGFSILSGTGTLENNFIFLDGLSGWLAWLVTLVAVTLIFGISKKNEYKFIKYYNKFPVNYTVLLLATLFMVLVCFLTKNLFVFFMFFEMILFPLTYHIVVQGSRVNRSLAIKYFVIYTLIGSIFLWLPLVYFIEILGSADFENLRWLISEYTNSGTKKLLFVSLFIGFSFKVPMVPLHQWLIIAHVEAPTSGSIILAALLLKIGGYGIYRYAFGLFPIEAFIYSNEIIILALFGYTYATMLAIRQLDIKRFIAYTSISHMNFSLIGLFSGFEIGILGFIHTMISHGIIATAMFYLVGFLYAALGYRDTLRITGLSEILPVFSIFWFIFSIANMGMPLFSAFPGEIFVFIAVAQLNKIFLFLMFVGFFFTGVYTFLQINKVLFSNYRGFLSSLITNRVSDLSTENIFVLSTLLFWTLALGICPDILIKNIEI